MWESNLRQISYEQLLDLMYRFGFKQKKKKKSQNKWVGICLWSSFMTFYVIFFPRSVLCTKKLRGLSMLSMYSGTHKHKTKLPSIFIEDDGDDNDVKLLWFGFIVQK